MRTNKVKTKEEYKKLFKGNKNETNVLDFIKEKSNETNTTNGDLAYKTTFNPFIDALFSIVEYRTNPNKVKEMVDDCFKIDPQLTAKLIFHFRDISEGKGERNTFRIAIKELSKKVNIENLIPLIHIYGRYDDLLCLLDKDIDVNTKYCVIKYIKEKLNEDIHLFDENKPISLLAKWLPSENTSSIKAREYAKIIRKSLGYNSKEYRQILSKLRKHIGIIETKITQEIFDFEYSQVPSCAMLKYKNIFLEKDNERYAQFLENVANGKTEIKAKNLFPHEIVREIRKLEYDDDKNKTSSLNLLWKNLKDMPIPKGTICMPDFSGSMTWSGHTVAPIDVACAMALYTSERLEGIWNNKFIAFSEEPKLIDVSKFDNIKDKVFFALKEYALNTNLDKAFQLILDVYKNENLNKDDIPTTLIIVSDMQFDECCTHNESTYDKYKRLFEENGLVIPKIIFWNVNSKVTIPTMNKQGVLLMSGYSVNNLKFLDTSYTPLDLLLDTLLDERYKNIFLDEIE